MSYIIYTERKQKIIYYKDELKGYKASDEDIVVVDEITSKKLI